MGKTFPGPPTPASAEAQRLPLRLWLTFSSSAYERRFVAHYVGFYHRYAQAALALGLLLVLGDFVVDLLAYPHNAANWLRLQLVLPLLLGGLGYTLLPTARRHWQPALAGFIVMVALALFWILLRIEREGGAGLGSWVGILNFTFLEFYCFVILGVQFRFALIAGLTIFAAFVTALWSQPGRQADTVFYWTYHVATLFLLPAGIGWWREYVLRRDFATRTQLDDARQSAEHLASVKGDFLAAMSHEIRTPLNGVLGMNELLLHSALSPQQRAWAEAVQASGRHLLAVINDVLDVSRIESGRLALEHVAFDLAEVLEDVLAMFLQPAQAKGLQLHVELMPHGTPPRLQGDPLRLRQILANLVGNAIKFTDRGHVRIAATVDTRDAEATLRIGVEDTGIGIPAEAHGRIFERFAQADSSITRKFGGTGLGLAICRQLADLMGGHIALDSAAGQGARFTLTLVLPLADAQAAGTAAAGAVPPTDTPAGTPDPAPLDDLPAPLHGTVLLVEDNAVNQCVAIGMLRRLGLQWQVATDGAIAIEALRHRAFDLVLMDCQMPTMDGYEATAAIRSLDPGRRRHLPIVALTANHAPEDIARCHAAGMDDFLAKPFTLASLQALLMRWLPAPSPNAHATPGGPVHPGHPAPRVAAASP